jgi:sugar phosphate isomerase/epimerase
MLTCAPDFTDPSAAARASQLEAMHRHVDFAALLGIPAVRVTAGPEHPGVEFEEALPSIVAAFAELAVHAAQCDVTLCVENHFRDRTWTTPDITAPPERFMRLLAAIEHTDVRINYDSAQPMVTETDELTLLDAVGPRVFGVHLGDRRRGARAHAVLGEGDVDLAGVLGRLNALGYDRFLTVEDGNLEGDAGLRRGLECVRRLVDATWVTA